MTALRQRQPPLRDPAYLKSFKGAMCWNCGSTVEGSVVPAHIRWGLEGGMGLRPSDDLTVPLCNTCHIQGQEAHPGPEWWANCLKAMARRRYRKWLEGKK